MIIHTSIEQNTLEWFALRAGKFTASLDFQQLVTGKPDTYKKLIRKKAAEVLTGKLVASEYTNINMERGNELEALAIKEFELATSKKVDRVGFVEGDKYFGCSPDGLIDDDCGIEIKCKDIHTHLNCFLDGYDTSYKWQIQGNLYVTNRTKWYFVSYNPHYEHLNKHLYIELIERDEEIINQISMGIKKGIEDITKLLEKFTN
jgi:predicted phage-related endonuclease